MKLFTMVLVLTGIVAGILFGASRSEARSGIITITALVETHRSNGHVINLKILRDKHNATIGWGDTVCIPVGNGSAQCVGTFNLPKGKLSVAGTRRSQNYFVFAIVGGTKFYNSVGGSLVGITGRDGHIHEHLIFSLNFPK